MFGIELTGQPAAVTTLVIIALMFVMFVRERHPPEVIAVGVAALMMVLGLAPYEESVGVLSNSAPWTIAFMFIIMGGLLRTGALDRLSRIVSARADTHPLPTIAAMFAFVCAASAIMNNTPVVAVMIPIVIQVARKAGIPASKLLMPLSYFTVMGGMITLIGTSRTCWWPASSARGGWSPSASSTSPPSALRSPRRARPSSRWWAGVCCPTAGPWRPS